MVVCRLQNGMYASMLLCLLDTFYMKFEWNKSISMANILKNRAKMRCKILLWSQLKDAYMISEPILVCSLCDSARSACTMHIQTHCKFKVVQAKWPWGPLDYPHSHFILLTFQRLNIPNQMKMKIPFAHFFAATERAITERIFQRNIRAPSPTESNQIHIKSKWDFCKIASWCIHIQNWTAHIQFVLSK